MKNKLSLVAERASLTSSAIKYAGFERQGTVNRNFNNCWIIKQQHNYVMTQCFHKRVSAHSFSLILDVC